MGLASGQEFYTANVRPLLAEMNRQFGLAVPRLEIILNKSPAGPRRFLEEIYDSAMVTWKRAEFVFSIYESLLTDRPADWRKARINEAVYSLKEASEAIELREAAYRVPLDRIAGWGRNTNPTRYVTDFNSTHSLLIWTFSTILDCFRRTKMMQVVL